MLWTAVVSSCSRQLSTHVQEAATGASCWMQSGQLKPSVTCHETKTPIRRCYIGANHLVYKEQAGDRAQPAHPTACVSEPTCGGHQQHRGGQHDAGGEDDGLAAPLVSDPGGRLGDQQADAGHAGKNETCSRAAARVISQIMQ